MSKRGHSPDILPTAKRRHTTSARKLASSLESPLSFLYDELILHIFAQLNWEALCLTQPVSRNWARLAGDNELWRKLYIKEFGRSRLRGSRGFVARQDRREVRPLRSRSDGEQYKDWKWMFRISSNWRRGRCAVDEAGSSLFDDVATPPTFRPDRSLLMLLAGPLIITASCLPTERPSIVLTDHGYQRRTLDCQPIQPGLAQITALALDQSPPRSDRLSLAIVLSTGEIFIFSFNTSDPSSLRQSLHYRPSRHSSRTNCIDAAYHHPLLVTLADPFSLSIFDISAGSVRHTQTLSTFTCYPPASLVLSSKCATQFKLIITYTIPVYPHHWSVGITEIRISRVAATSVPSLYTGLSSAPSFMEDFRCSADTMAVVSTRTIRAFDVPNGWIDDTALITMREQWGRKLLNVASVQTDGKWVILAPGNDLCSLGTLSHGTSPTPSTSHVPRSSIGLQLYRLVLPSHSNSISASPPKLNFVRTLHGHTSPISAVALADGRCISLGENGNIWVWDLEAGTGAEVTSPDKTSPEVALPSTKGVISFDERRIVSAIAGKVVVRRFDI